MITPEERDSLMRALDTKHALIFPDMLPSHKQLRLKRAHDSLTLIQLSEVTGVPKTTLSEIECGRRIIPRKHKVAIEDYLYHQYWSDGKLLERWEQ
ncbi:helix-turn-helix transcriptional regulator [Priestia megaterium]|uniref:helix-turn-helix domain-containing protein n=1 Tax=Priestia megaterium TaxID=1404 RepID=UPI002FFD9664